MKQKPDTKTPMELKTPVELTDTQLDQVAGGAQPVPPLSSAGTVTGFLHGGLGGGLPYPFTEETVVPEQAAASYYNPSFVSSGLYTAGGGNPKGNVGNS